MNLRELLEAREGRPTEQKAVTKIATFAVIPAAIIGLLVGTRLVDVTEPIGKLLWVCTAAAFGSGAGIVFAVFLIYYLFGFRPVALLADALAGGFIGLLCGGLLALLAMWQKLISHDVALWLLLLIPLGSILFPLVRVWSEKSHSLAPSESTTESRINKACDQNDESVTRNLKP